MGFLRLGAVIVSMFLAGACVTTEGWTQEGKTEKDRKRDNGECRAQANQTCNGNGFCVNNAYGECMEGRGWSKD